MITSRREGNINKQTKLKISSHSIIDRSVRFACVRAVRGQCDRSAGSAVTSLARASTGTVLTPRQMSEIAGHVVEEKEINLIKTEIIDEENIAISGWPFFHSATGPVRIMSLRLSSVSKELRMRRPAGWQVGN